MLAVLRESRLLSMAAVIAAVFAVVSLPGCRTTRQDVERWMGTVNGPRKLVAVVTHAKYGLDLRVDAAMALVQMKPRNGQHVGLQGGEDTDQPGLLKALSGLAPAVRTRIVSGMVPRLVEGMGQPAPEPGQPDATIRFKDAAFALLTYEDGALVSQEADRVALRAALADWAVADFVQRLENPMQAYGMEQVLRELGTQGVRRLPDLIKPDEAKLGQMVSLIADLGDQETKDRASAQLVRVAQYVNTEKWKEQKAPAVKEANEASRLTPTPDQFRRQLDQYQEEELLRVFASMKRVGGAAVVKYLIDFAQDARCPGGDKDPRQRQSCTKRRAAAVAALEGRIDKANPKHVKAMLALSSNPSTPDSVRDLALRRVGEMPRELVIKDLYAMFETDNWRVRWVAAELVLKMSTTQQLGEFMRHLAKAKNMAITEAIRYGNLIDKMKGPPAPREVAEKYASLRYPVEARVAALGYFHEYGTKKDLPFVQQYAGDLVPVPVCGDGPEAQGCEWRCAVGSGNTQQLKDIMNVGDYVRDCVEPAMERRSERAASKEPSK